MQINELIAALEKIGINGGIPQKTIKRWAYQGIISPPIPPTQKGRGHTGDWEEKSLLQAAGIWAMQQASASRLTVPEILNLRIMGDEIHKRGRCKCIYPNLNKLIEQSSPLQSLRLRQDSVDLDVPIELVDIGFDVFDDNPRHNVLYATYVCAKEKAWHSIHSSETWPIMKPAWTYLYYVEVQKDIETPEPYPQIELSYSLLEEAKQNKPFFFFDGRDARAVPEYQHPRGR